jgi:hypothetical protein
LIHSRLLKLVVMLSFTRNGCDHSLLHGSNG